PLTEDLRVDQLRPLLRRVVERFGRHVTEVLPEELRQRHGFPDAPEALRAVHFPESLQAAQRGRQRFVYEEFLILQLALALRRRKCWRASTGRPWSAIWPRAGCAACC